MTNAQPDHAPGTHEREPRNAGDATPAGGRAAEPVAPAPGEERAVAPGDGVPAVRAGREDAMPSKMTPRAVAALTVAGTSLFLLFCFATYGTAESGAARGPGGIAPTVASWFVEPLGAGAHVAALLGAVWGIIAYFQERTPDLVLRGVGTIVLAASTASIVGLSHGGVRTLWAGTVGTFGARMMTDLGSLGTVLGWVVFLSLFAVSFVFATDWFFRSLLRSGRRTFDPRALPVEPPRGDLLEDPSQVEPREFIRDAARTPAVPVAAAASEPAVVAPPAPSVDLESLPKGLAVVSTGERPVVRGVAGYSGVEFLAPSDELAEPEAPRSRRAERVFVNTPDDDAHDGMSFEPQAELATHETDTDTVDSAPEPHSGIGLADASMLVDEVFSIPSHYVEPESPHDGGSAVSEIAASLAHDVVVRVETPAKHVAAIVEETPEPRRIDSAAVAAAQEDTHAELLQEPADREPAARTPAPIPPVSAPVVPRPEPVMTVAQARAEVAPADAPAIHADASAPAPVPAVAEARSAAVSRTWDAPADVSDEVLFDDVVYIYDESAGYAPVAPSVGEAIHDAVARSPAAVRAEAEAPITAAVEQVAAYVRGELERDPEPVRGIEIDEFVHFAPAAVAFDSDFEIAGAAAGAEPSAAVAVADADEDVRPEPQATGPDRTRMSEALQLVFSEPLPVANEEPDADEAVTEETPGLSVPRAGEPEPALRLGGESQPSAAVSTAEPVAEAAVAPAPQLPSPALPVPQTIAAAPAAPLPAPDVPVAAPTSPAARPAAQLGLFAKPECDLSRLHAMELDPMFFDAAAAIVARGRASAVVLQRALGVGYARGLRILDQMTEAGMLGPDAPGGARDIHYTQAQWDDFSGSL